MASHAGDFQEDEDGNNTSSLKRTRRPVISCLECRRKKLKCDRTHPCQQCKRIGRPGGCLYQVGQEPESRTQESSSSSSPHVEKRQRIDTEDASVSANIAVKRPSSTTPRSLLQDHFIDSSSSPMNMNPATAPMGIIEDLQNRVRKLEQVIETGHPLVESANSHDYTPPVEVIRNNPNVSEFHVDEWGAPLAAFGMARSFMYKIQDGSDDQEISALAQDMRSLHNLIKARCKSLKQVEAPALTVPEILRCLPDNETCEALAGLYFANFEHCYRILHRPTFDRQFREFWGQQHSLQNKSSFLPQLCGVLSIVAALKTSPLCNNIGLQKISDGATTFMQSYIDNLSTKEGNRLPAIQTRLLLFILRWVRSDRVGDLWHASGQTLRQALMMGLDKDPGKLPKTSPSQAELRRRIWYTIVEQDLMASLLCNMPCMVPYFTCRPPLNVNDSEISDESKASPASRPLQEWTDNICQHILAQNLLERVEVCKAVGNRTSVKYEEIVNITRRLERSLQNLPSSLKFGGDTDRSPIRLMAGLEIDMSIRRVLLYLYSPFSHAMPIENDTYAEARVGFNQSCLMIGAYRDLFDPKYSELDVFQPEGYWDFFYNCYKYELNQATLGLSIEIKRLTMQSSDQNKAAATTATSSPGNGRMNSLSSVNLNTPGGTPSGSSKSSLIHAVKDAIEPMTRRISRVGSNLKDLAYLTIVFNSVKSQNQSIAENMIKEGLRDLVSACKLQLGRDGVEMSTPHMRNGSDAELSVATSSEFDLTWTSFAGLDWNSVLRFEESMSGQWDQGIPWQDNSMMIQ
ncbi:hypothetical protein TWF694_002128 [Orbilia ellipsospora]|uniref:Zn(2)-C6 fungal-type domain-containing protein n=1 Tax=Orbilia ellipsospora TaxID=2528407 RepID=A0AAV9XAT8_9PEZI